MSLGRENRENEGEEINRIIYNLEWKGMNFFFEGSIVIAAKYHSIMKSQEPRDNKSTLQMLEIKKFRNWNDISIKVAMLEARR